MGRVTIIRVEQANDLSARQPDALVYGIIQPLVRFTDYPQMGVSFKNLKSPVGGTAVHDNVLNSRVILGKHALDGINDKIGPVQRRCDNGNQILNNCSLSSSWNRRFRMCDTKFPSPTVFFLQNKTIYVHPPRTN